jgi:hypothetical protein
MKASSKTIKQYIHASSCRIHDAVCLIYGFDPKVMVIENYNNYRERRFQSNLSKFETLLQLLCAGQVWWRMSCNIFYYVEKTLKNNMTVSQGLTNAIQQYVKNLTEIDYKLFQNHYPYIIRGFQDAVMTLNVNVNDKHIPRFSTEERNRKYQEIANKIWQEKPSLTKEEIAQQVYNTLLKEDPEYLIDKRSEQSVAVGTILKNFRKKRR